MKYKWKTKFKKKEDKKERDDYNPKTDKDFNYLIA